MAKETRSINVRLSMDEYKKLTETINSYADYSLVPPKISDVIREGIRLVHKKEVLGLIKELESEEKHEL